MTDNIVDKRDLRIERLEQHAIWKAANELRVQYEELSLMPEEEIFRDVAIEAGKRIKEIDDVLGDSLYPIRKAYD